MAKVTRQDLRRSAWLVLALIVVTASMRWMIARTRAERLFDMPGNGELRLLGIRGDDAIFISNSQAPTSRVEIRSLRDKVTRTVSEDQSLKNAFSLVLTDDALYFKSPPPGAAGPSGGGPMPGMPQRAGASPVETPGPSKPPSPEMVKGGPGAALTPKTSPDAATPMPTMNARADTVTPMPTVTMRNQPMKGVPWPLDGAGDPPGVPNITGIPSDKSTLRRLELRGGSAKEIHAPLARNPYAQRDYAILGDWVYFNRFIPDPPPKSSSPLKERLKCSVDLLKCPVAGGAPEVVKSVPGVLSMLYASRDHLYWIVGRREAPGRVDLYHMAKGENRLQCIPDYESWAPAVAAGDRLYWVTRHFVRNNPKTAAVTLETSDLVSARMDGQDRRVVEHIIEAGQYLKYIGRPIAHRNRVYIQVSDRGENPEGMERKESVFRVRAGDSGLEHVMDLPAHTNDRGFIESGWFYFSIAERHQGWMDYMRDGANLEFVEVLHRMRMPDN